MYVCVYRITVYCVASDYSECILLNFFFLPNHENTKKGFKRLKI